MGDRLPYALHSEVSVGALARKKSFLPDETDLSCIINEEWSDSTSFCYGEIKSPNERIRWVVLELVDILEEREAVGDF